MSYFADVYCSTCECKHSVKEVEFLNIEEDYMGRDLMTFTCSANSTPQTSLVFAAGFRD